MVFVVLIRIGFKRAWLRGHAVTFRNLGVVNCFYFTYFYHFCRDYANIEYTAELLSQQGKNCNVLTVVCLCVTSFCHSLVERDDTEVRFDASVCHTNLLNYFSGHPSQNTFNPSSNSNCVVRKMKAITS